MQWCNRGLMILVSFFKARLLCYAYIWFSALFASAGQYIDDTLSSGRQDDLQIVLFPALLFKVDRKTAFVFQVVFSYRENVLK